MNRDLYEILGVKRDANEGEIRKAFLKHAKKFHPDVNPGNKEAEQKFKEVNFAYEVLKDPKKRAQYDQVGVHGFAGAESGAQAGGPKWRTASSEAEFFADFGLGDLFQEIFGNRAGGAGAAQDPRRGRGRPGNFARRGNDREMALSISFQEACRGGQRMIEFQDGRRLTVKIPEGVENGQKIKLSAQGDAGIAGGPAGDLFLVLEVQPHPVFTREGRDIVVKLPLTFSEAVLGGEVEVPTLDGRATVKVPSGVSSGQRLKLTGKGIRSVKNDMRGDQYAEIAIKVPRDPSAAYREAAERSAQDPFNPREGLF